MSFLKKQSNIAVWVNENRCKGCDICVSLCPAGVLAMVYAPYRTIGVL